MYTVEEAAPLLGVSIYTVRNHCNAGLILAKNVGNERYKRWLIPKSSITKYKSRGSWNGKVRKKSVRKSAKSKK